MTSVLEGTPGGAPYVWDAERRLFRREGSPAFAYSDGAEVEQRLLKVMTEASDRSVLSDELRGAVVDWPSEYHLSRFRHCLVRPLGIRPGDKVLEVGAGCGAITRYLGELGARVTAVEGSLLRGAIAAARCVDLPNVKVVVDDLLRFESEESFDWLLMIGVLEYAPVFSAKASPVQDYLNGLKRFLAPGGRLVVAIENKLGLKYFNACGEDHLGTPFLGIQDLYASNTPRTYGRAELVAELASAGFLSTRFFYPFPDYKLPSVIISEEGMRDEGLRHADLLLRVWARDYSGHWLRVFDERLVSRTLFQNGLSRDLSNSFLVVAGQRDFPSPFPGELATTYSCGRSANFASVTTLRREAEKISITKEFIAPGLSRTATTKSGLVLHNSAVSSDYVVGRQVVNGIIEARARNAPLPALVAAFQPWLRFLLKHSTNSRPSGPAAGQADLKSWVIDGSFFDCTPFNLIETDSALVQIDKEWQTGADVPLGWVVTRGILWSLRDGYASPSLPPSVPALVQSVIRGAELETTERDIVQWLSDEADLQSAVTGLECTPESLSQLSGGYLPVLAHMERVTHIAAERAARLAGVEAALQERESRVARLQEGVETQGRALAAVQTERDALANQVLSMESSISWRWTKPVRYCKHRVRSLARQIPAPLRTFLKRLRG